VLNISKDELLSKGVSVYQLWDLSMKTKKVSLNQQSSFNTKVADDFPIVGIGASAGGLDPIRKLLETLPVDTGMAFVVIQHLAPGQESLLPEILSRSTKMKVQQVKDGIQVEQNQVYVITPGTTMTLKNSHLRLVPKGVALKPINDFMVSLASERKTQAIGIVLSGTGNDGTEGLKAIKVDGGITFVQDPETAQYDDMPKNAISAETAYFILSPENIAKEIVRLAKNPQLTSGHLDSPRQAESESDLKKILMMLKVSSGVDFTHYKETTISRRIARRMTINKIESEKEYAAFVRAHPKELQALFDDLLIGVTSFFREPKTFEALADKVFPELIKNLSANESIRVWIPGCSTGEEVYSLAIAIQEFLEEKALPEIRVQIFGTDANEKNIEKARQGVYPKTIADNVSEKKLKRFFSTQNGNFQITKLIRDMCIFAKQDITSDPPFSNMDLIMCRNVLIYFDSLLHERVFPIFHYGLKSNGFLVLGESESIGKFQYLFEPITTKGLIFKKKRTHPQAILNQETFVPYVFHRKGVKQPEKPNSMLLLKEEVDRLLMAEYVPATLIVSNNLEILFFRGQVNPYLTHEPGIASLNVTKIVQKELRTNIQTAIYMARKENKTLKETVEFKQEGRQKRVSIQVKPLKTSDYEEPFFLVTLEEPSVQRDNLLHENEPTADPAAKETAKDKQINSLKGDLESTKLHLQTIIEVQEATNEELRSTMEEAQSGNEELQSTNEELETAKEELQSGNEELQTLNEELKNRNQALGRLNDDLSNLQKNIDIPIVILDNDLRIRRFTASAQGLLNISPSDIGRTINFSNVGIQKVDLEKTIKDVNTKLTIVTQEVADVEDRWYEMWVRPYLTEERKIDGTVISFSDITESKKAKEKLNKTNGELMIANEKLRVIGKLIRHDVGNKLLTVTGNAYLLKKKHGDQTDIVDGLGKMEQAIEDSLKIFDFARSYEQIGIEDLISIDVGKAVAEAVSLSAGLTFKVVNECQRLTVLADSSLKQLFYNFIDNTRKHGKKTTTVRIYYELTGSGDLKLIYEDNGIGISKENKSKLFSEGFSTGGTGFGLFLIKKMIDVYGWKIEEKGKPDEGAKFIITIPKLNKNEKENYRIEP
jgi:two-component system, chemotaxis family, CheB/CheR fusion protein